MKKLVLTAVAGVVMALAGTTAASAHGCHRSPDEGRAGWHRHVGPDCDRVSVERRRHWGRDHRDHGRRDYRPACHQVCTGVGPLRFCERHCD